MNFAQRLSDAIKASGMLQKDVALALGMAKDAMTDYVSGKSTPDPDRIRRLCQILGCRYEDLLGELD